MTTGGLILVLVAVVIAIEALKNFGVAVPAAAATAPAAVPRAAGGSPGGPGGPADVAAWVDAHRTLFSAIAPMQLATWLTAQGFSETQFTDVTNSVGATGPYQFYGPTLQNAQGHGFDVHTVTGSLDAFLASGDLQIGITAYNAAKAVGATDETAARAAYLAMGRPGNSPGELANLARWPEYYAQALAALGQPQPSTSQPIPTP
jgi:hypothetical protein